MIRILSNVCILVCDLLVQRNGPVYNHQFHTGKIILKLFIISFTIYDIKRYRQKYLYFSFGSQSKVCDHDINSDDECASTLSSNKVSSEDDEFSLDSENSEYSN